MEQPTEPVMQDETVHEVPVGAGARHGIVRPDARWVGGTAAGIAARLGIDAALVRALFVLASLIGGFGLIVYGLGWLFLPDATTGRSLVRNAFRGRPSVELIGAIAVTGAGLMRPITWVSFAYRDPWEMNAYAEMLYVWVGILALFAALMVAVAWWRRRRGLAGPASFGPTTAPMSTAPTSASEAPTARLATLRATKPRKPRVPGPGRTHVLLTFAAALLFVAAWLAFVEAAPTPRLILSILGGLLLIFGASSAVAAVRGRRGSALTAATVLLVPLTAAATAIGMVLPPTILTVPVTSAGDVTRELWQLEPQTDLFLGRVLMTTGDTAGSGTQRVRDIAVGLGSVDVGFDHPRPTSVTVTMGAGSVYFTLADGWTVRRDGQVLQPTYTGTVGALSEDGEDWVDLEGQQYELSNLVETTYDLTLEGGSSARGGDDVTIHVGSGTVYINGALAAGGTE